MPCHWLHIRYGIFTKIFLYFVRNARYRYWSANLWIIPSIWKKRKKIWEKISSMLRKLFISLHIFEIQVDHNILTVVYIFHYCVGLDNVWSYLKFYHWEYCWSYALLVTEGSNAHFPWIFIFFQRFVQLVYVEIVFFFVW